MPTPSFTSSFSARVFRSGVLCLALASPLTTSTMVASPAQAQTGSEAETSHRLALTHRSAGRLPEALTAAREAVRLRPDHARYHFTLAGILRLQSDYAGALAEYRRAGELEPRSQESIAMTGAMLARLNRCEEALPILRRAVEITATDASSWGNLGTCLRRLRRVDEAITAYQTALAANPSDPDLLNNYAVALRQAGRAAEAITALETALARSPDDGMFHLNLAIALRASERWETAAQHYESWARLTPAPTDPSPLFDLGYCYEQLHRTEQAVDAYDRYLSLVRDRDPAAVDRVEQRLEELIR
jgi:Flp pilus assembly protein TadD